VVEASGRISRRVASRRGEQRLRARERRGEGGKRKRQKVVRTRFGKFVCRLHPRMSRSAGEKRTPQLARTFAPTPSIPVSLHVYTCSGSRRSARTARVRKDARHTLTGYEQRGTMNYRAR